MNGSRRKALFSEGNIPPGGTCLSSFVVVSRGSSVLVGKMAKPEAWVQRFFVGPDFAKAYARGGKYVIPARHLAWYESPLDAAIDIMSEEVLLPVGAARFRLLGVQSHVRSDPRGKEPPHWDICFVYEVKLSRAEAGEVEVPEWFEDLEFRARSGLSPSDFARGHGDVLEEAGVIRVAR